MGTRQNRPGDGSGMLGHQNKQIENTINQLEKDKYKVVKEYNEAGQFSKVIAEPPLKRTGWDWLLLFVQLIAAIAIPIVIAAGTASFSYQQNQTSLQIAESQQQEATLKSYLDDMSDLLINQHLLSPKLPDEIRMVARVRTLTTLRRLDPLHKVLLLEFLDEAGLIDHCVDNPHTKISSGEGGPGAIISLNGADLSNINLSRHYFAQVDLSGANLSGANLTRITLSRACLYSANLSGANLSHADLNGTELSKANLDGANLSESDLRGVHLKDTSLDKTILKGALYNTKETGWKDADYHDYQLLPTEWPDGFDPKAAGAIETDLGIKW
jgi:uncharacterized protein YjbI with pentapeptide repeats